MRIGLYRAILAAIMLMHAAGAAGQIVALQTPGSKEVVIGNPLVSRDDDNIIVEYDLLIGELVRSCNVCLQVSMDAGKTYKTISGWLTGDRNNITSSGHKTIMIPLSRYGGEFTGKSLSFNLVVSHKSVMKFNYLDAEDLSVNGTANCYIVSKSGVYSFKPVMGNSSMIVGNVSSVEVLWESFGTAICPKVGDLVQDVEYSSGNIFIKIPDEYKEGNAVIAAKDDTGTILWSWHIWLTDMPGKCVYANNAGTMMDRNLGATSITPGDVCAFGLLYQWGRKDPFLGPMAITSTVEAKSTITWPSPVSSSFSLGTIKYATNNPTTYITYNTKNFDWHFSAWRNRDKTRWQSSKTIYDPCPPGWRVPDGGPYGVWKKAGFSNLSYDSSIEGIVCGDGISSPSTWYPAAGYRDRREGSLQCTNRMGQYWSVSHGEYGECFMYFCINSVGSVTMGGGGKASARSVRCIRE